MLAKLPGVSSDINASIIDYGNTQHPATEGTSSPHPPFDNILNFRDVGAYVNRLCGSRYEKPPQKATSPPVGLLAVVLVQPLGICYAVTALCVLKEGILFRSARWIYGVLPLLLRLSTLNGKANGKPCFTKLNNIRTYSRSLLMIRIKPDDASQRDQERLTNELRLASIIDLRSTTEHTMAANRRLANERIAAEEGAETSLQPKSIANDEHLVNLPGVRRIMLSLAGWNFEKTLLWRLSWFNILKFFSLLASGYRGAATRLIVEQTIVPRGLNGLARDTLTASQAEIKELFGYLSEPSIYPTVIHCTQGKDRTGLVVILLLLLVSSGEMKREESEAEAPGGEAYAALGRPQGTVVVTGTGTGTGTGKAKIPLSVITSDYRLSEGELTPELEERLREMNQLGLPDEFAKCWDGFTEDVVEFLEERYGGIRGYLKAVGVDAGAVEMVRGLLGAC
ncbi:uncharacterized protein PADG_03920 [Paracoccidioides brasiliensis Pb18]|uniref:Tyrosine specific protein phosphatases domain-containing protein n=1 Tax=Paracoccidioides brasiliensis (strain Pb18) TaxID=502780 RepID=C1G9I4_PARBD|nr:uncharacterized protein PADG_03920 [Paracoccidioides brasiliensis Pb18]EEH47836.2 hypothetical protein PADG_03920 [Paracoccidioides brasiliensis Pb18]